MSQAADTLEPTSDRRASPRVPVERTVKLGPAHRPTRATLSAGDMSRSGVFVEASVPVRVGARFSAELELSSGAHVYIPEAEVAHVGTGPNRGFGIRFIDLPNEVNQLLAEEMARLDPAPMPTVTPALVLAEDEDDTDAPEHAPGASAWIEPMTELPEPLDTTIDRRPAMRMPSHWTIMLGLGCVFLFAAAVFVVMAELEAKPPSVQSVPLESGLPSETHDVLMERAEAPPMEPVPEEAVDLAPLPLVPERTPVAAHAPEAAPPLPMPEPSPVMDGEPRMIEFDVPTDARVKTSYALSKPPRFVIDLVGVDRAPASRGEDPMVTRVRFGLHPGFSRLVLDLRRPLEGGDARLRGGRLSVRLVPRS
ncbi:MAG: PilZ domain-containing protein [Myxococcota bacterium]